jgi:hypothetical protein
MHRIQLDWTHRTLFVHAELKATKSVLKLTEEDAARHVAELDQAARTIADLMGACKVCTGALLALTDALLLVQRNVTTMC